METWNNRLLKALEESTFNKNSLAERVGVSAPTVSAWVGAAGINPAKTIAGDNLLKVCRALNIRPEWLMFREGPMRASSVDPELAAAIDLIATLPGKARELILVQIKGYADLTSQKVNEEAAEKGGTIGHPQQRGDTRQSTADQTGVIKTGEKLLDFDEAAATVRRLAGVEGAAESPGKRQKKGSKSG